MKKRVVSLWIAFAMMFTMLPQVVVPAEAAEQEPGEKRLVKIIQTIPGNGSTTEYIFTYNDNGWITEVSSTQIGDGYEYSELIELVYDSEGRLIERRYPLIDWIDWPVDTYTYNEDGFLVSEMHSEGSSSEEIYTLDENGRALKKTISTEFGTETHVFSYDSKGLKNSTTITSTYQDGTSYVDICTYMYAEDGRVTEEYGSFHGNAYYYSYLHYKPFVICEKTGSDHYEVTLEIQDRAGHEIWSLQYLYDPEYMLDEDGYVTKIEATDYSGNGSTLVFVYEDIAGSTPTNENHARAEWIRQHIDYAASEAYEAEIVAGFSNRMLAVFRDALDDEDIKSYEARKELADMLELDIELSEADMYELILAEILYGEKGLHLTEEVFGRNLQNELEKYEKMLVDIVNSVDAVKELPKDVKNEIKGLYELLQTLEYGTEEYSQTLSKFFDQIQSNGKDLIQNWKTDLLGDAAFVGAEVVVDGAFEKYDALEDIASYLANYAAYRSTSQQTRDVLDRLAVNVFYKYEGFHGESEFRDELGLQASVINWYDLQIALASVMQAMHAYEQEGAQAVAEYAAERKDAAEQKFGAQALKAVSVFVVEKAASCVPVLNTILIAKNATNAGIRATIILDQVLTNVDDREYALDVLVKTYCISVMLDHTVEDCRNSMSEDDFYSTTVFDESVSFYKKNLLIAIEYAVKYTDMILKNAKADLMEYDNYQGIDRLFRNRDEMVAVVEWYINSLKLLEEQRIEIQKIACHDADLQYDSEADEITYTFEDSRVYIVACPVDVIVTTDTGEQIAYLSGEENQVASGYEFYFHTIRLTDDSDEYIKVAVVPDNYQIELKGTDDGVMHAFITDYTTDDVGEVETYFNVPIKIDSIGAFEEKSDGTNEHSLVMDQAVYSSMECIEDLPADTETYGVVLWGVGGVLAVIAAVLIVLLLKRKK